MNSYRFVVVDSAGEPVPGAVIRGSGALTAVEEVTGYDGEACLRVARGSTLTFLAEARGAVSEVVLVEAGEADEQCDAAGSVIELVLEQACLSGRVIEEDGTPVGDATVSAVGSSSSASASTAADGTYCVVVPPGATVELGAFAELRRSEVLTIDTGGAAACGDDACTTAPDLVVRGTCMEGRVVDAFATPRAGVLVEGSSAGRVARATTAADGTYCLAAEPGFTVTASTELAAPVSAVAPRDEAECGGPGCGALPDLVVASACLSGTVTGLSGVDFPGVEAVVHEANGTSIHYATVDPVDGSYCVEVPRGSVAEVTATGSVLGTPIGSLAERVEVPEVSSECGGPDCALVPTLTLDALTCLDVGVVDDDGAPVNGATVRLSYVDRALVVHDQAEATTVVDGEVCFPAPPDTLVRLTVEEPLGVGDGTSEVRPIPVASGDLVTQTLETLVCGADVCDPVTLVRPRVGCVDVTLTDSRGAAIDGGYVNLRWDGIRGMETQEQFTDLGGGACFEAPQGTYAVLEAGGFPQSGAASVTVPVGPEARCGSSACVPVAVQTLPTTCVSGTIVDGAGAPVDSSVLSWREDLSYDPPYRPSVGVRGQSSADPGGTWCIDVPTNRELTIGARSHDEYGVVVAAGSARWTSGATPGRCGVASCQAGPQIVVEPEHQSCLSGRAWLHEEALLAVPAGTPVFAYTTGAVASCDPGADDPRSWGVVAGESVVGPDGRFCVPVPVAALAPSQLVLNVGGCAVAANVASEVDFFSVSPPTIAGGCSQGTCQDVGALVLLR